MYGYIYFTKSKFKENEEITGISGKPKKKIQKNPKNKKKTTPKPNTNKNQYLSPSNPKQTNKQKEKMKPYSPKKRAENREAMSHSHQDSIVFSNIKHKTKKFREINGVFFLLLL